MRYTTHRFALFAALCCFSLLLVVGMAAPAGAGLTTPPAGSGASGGTWVQVFDWSGGGSGNDIRNSAPFTLQGGQQYFSVSTVAVTGEYTWPMASWTVESVDGSGGFAMFAPPDMGLSQTYMYLPAGSYYVSCNTLDCKWLAGLFELRPTVTVTSFTPTSGPVGTGVILTGTGFTGATTIAFNGTLATTFTVVSPTHITTTVPVGATTGTIAVTAPGGTATSATSFTVTPPVPAPIITSFTPASGPVGTPVTVIGAGFMYSGAPAVSFNGAAATCTADSFTQITATVPASATSGPITVTTAGGTASSATSFTVMTPAKPKIVRLKPASGKRGAPITITGAGFGAVRGTGSVKFGATTCTKYFSWSATQITCKVSAKAKYGAIKLTVTTTAGKSNAMSFTVKR